MFKYVCILFHGRNNTTVLLPNGTTRKVQNDHMYLWEREENPQIELDYRRNHVRTRRSNEQIELDRINGTDPHIFHNPQRQEDRIYVKILHRGKGKNVKVLLRDGNELFIPVEYFSTWKSISSYEHERGARTISDIRFGIEIEFIADSTRIEEFNSRMSEITNCNYVDDHYRHYVSNGNQWVLGTDCSVKPTSTNVRYRNYSGYELVSPIMSFNTESFSLLKKVMRTIREVFKGEVNKTCGQHVHFSGFCEDINETSGDSTLNLMKKAKDFFNFYGSYEECIFDKLVSPSRRSSNNHYAYSCECPRLDASDEFYGYSRYNKINLLNFRAGKIGTIENRQHQGTLEAKKIWSWIELNSLFLLKFFNYGEFQSDDVEDFFSKVGLSEETTSYFIQRMEELN